MIILYKNTYYHNVGIFLVIIIVSTIYNFSINYLIHSNIKFIKCIYFLMLRFLTDFYSGIIIINYTIYIYYYKYEKKNCQCFEDFFLKRCQIV